MAIQTINIGNRVNDGLGDDLRTAFQKVNANFAELETSLTVTASNIGITGEGIFKQKNGLNLEFKNLVAGAKIALAGFEESVRISSTQADAFTRITTNSDSITANEIAGTNNITIQGGQGARNVEVTADSITGVIEVDTILDLKQILLSYDFGNVTGDYEHPIQFALATANIDFGTITNPGRMSLDIGGI
jgi:hypothetical protein